MVRLHLHLAVGTDTNLFWWANSPDTPTLLVSAARLTDCRQRALDALAAHGIDTREVDTVLADLAIR